MAGVGGGGGAGWLGGRSFPGGAGGPDFLVQSRGPPPTPTARNTPPPPPTTPPALALKGGKAGPPFPPSTQRGFFFPLHPRRGGRARLRMPSEADKQRIIAASPETHQVPEPILRANQMYVEAFLLDHVRTRANITLRYGWEVDAIREDADGVTIEAEDAGGGKRETWRAQYLAGCDGGRSSVRRTLGVRYNGFASMDSAFYGGSMIASYVRAPTLDRDYLAHRPGWQYWVVNNEMRVVIVSLNGRDEFLIFTKVMDPDRPPDDATVTDIVRRGTGVDIPVAILGHRPWTAGAALVADSFGAGRVVLAGDSGSPCSHRPAASASIPASTMRPISPGSSPRWCGAGAGRVCSTPTRSSASRSRIATRQRRASLRSTSATSRCRPRSSAIRRKATRHAARRVASYRPWARSLPRLACNLAPATTAPRSSCRTARRLPRASSNTRRAVCRAGARRTSGSTRAGAGQLPPRSSRGRLHVAAPRAACSRRRSLGGSGERAFDPAQGPRPRNAGGARTLRRGPRAGPARRAYRLAGQCDRRAGPGAGAPRRCCDVSALASARAPVSDIL